MLHIFAQTVIILILVGYGIFLFRSRFSLKALYISALSILAGGTVLYMFGYSMEPVHQGGVTLLLRSVLSSAEMFVTHHDLLEIETIQEESKLFLDLFFLFYTAAIMTTVSTVISIFSKRVITSLLLTFHKKMEIKHVFLGYSHKGVTLARTITDGKVAFIEFPKEKEAETKSISHVLMGGAKGNKVKDRLNTREIPSLRARRNIYDLDGCEDILKEIGLSKLKRHLAADADFYIVTKYVDRNLQTLINMRKDPFFDGHKIHVYTKKSALVTLYEDSHPEFETDFLHVSNLCVRQIAMNDALMPTDGSAALILGFGETGQDVAKYIHCLFEDMRIIAFDKSMDASKGAFMATNQAMVKSGRVLFEQAQLGTGSFWEKVSSHLDDIHYVVAAVDDDQENISIAGGILKFCAASRKGGTKGLKVLVRQERYNESHHMIIDNLNARFGEGTVLPFGEDEQIFTSDYIM